MFDSMYQKDDRDSEIFLPIAEYFKPPDVFVHGKWHLIAEIPKIETDGDGQACRIYECRLPSRFFKLEVLQGPNSAGETNAGFCLTTGSGDEMGELIAKIALAIAQGMIGLCKEENT